MEKNFGKIIENVMEFAKESPVVTTVVAGIAGIVGIVCFGICACSREDNLFEDELNEEL